MKRKMKSHIALDELCSTLVLLVFRAGQPPVVGLSCACRIFSSTPAPLPIRWSVGASYSCPVISVTTKNISRPCQVSPGRAHHLHFTPEHCPQPAALFYDYKVPCTLQTKRCISAIVHMCHHSWGSFEKEKLKNWDHKSDT